MGIQPVQRLEPDAARESLTYMATRSTAWFTVKDGVFNKGSKFLHRPPNGCAQAAMASLEAERCQIQSDLSRVLAGGTSSEASVSAVLDSNLPHMSPALPVLAREQHVERTGFESVGIDKSLTEIGDQVVLPRRKEIDVNRGEEASFEVAVGPETTTTKNE